jgi:hypothetical protein
MTGRDLTADDVADWLTPSQAVEILESKFGKGSGSYIAKHTLLERIRGGRVRAVADQDEQLVEVGPENWSHVAEADIFWTSGDLTFKARGFHEWSAVRFYDVRFDSQAVRAIVGNVPQSAQESAQPTTTDEPKRRLPDPHLAAWFEFYKKIGGEMREDPATAHVHMCFPSNSVSRQRIRDLLGPRPMGRPKTGNS